MRRGLRLVVLALVASLVTGLALSTTVGARKGSGKSGKSNKALKANLTGATEVPGPGDPDGTGKAGVELLPRYGAVCFRLRTENIGDQTAAHIHRGAKGVAGPVVVTLFDGDVKTKGCTDGVDEDLLREIRRSPRAFYVNVHTTDFPAGAIRGQLKRSGRHRGRGGDKRSNDGERKGRR